MSRQKPNDPVLERGLPCDTGAERSVLGAVLLSTPVIDQAAELLRREDFFLESHRRIFDHMIALRQAGAPIDLITLSNVLRTAGEFEQIGGATYIAGLIDGVPRTDTIEPYAKLILEKSMLRQEITTANQIIARCYEGEKTATEIAEEAQGEFHKIVDRTTASAWEHVGDVADRKLEQIEAMAGRPEMVTGVPTGYVDWDRMTSGLQKQELIVVAARVSQGKSALGFGIAAFAAKQKYVVGIVSLEMSAEQVVARLLCGEARVDSHRFRTGYLNSAEWGRLGDALGTLKNCQIWIEDRSRLTASMIRAKARQLQSAVGLDLLIVDYLGLMGAEQQDSRRSREQEVARMSSDLKSIAKELDIPVIALAQLNRDPEKRTSHKPQLSDLKDSGAIEADADMVCLIYREEQYYPTDENQGCADLIIAKQRNGPTGTVQLAWLAEFAKFESMWRE